MAEVAFDHVGKVFEDGTEAVVDFTLDIADGESMVLVGPSGCGKSTLLRMVAGLEEITTGEISIGGTVVNDMRPKHRDTAMVFQNYALYPHLNVDDNVGFSLRLRRMPRRLRREAVRRGATTLKIDQYLAQRPRNLSGGQQQRVAMGRAIVRQPNVFLLDEPLSNLDAKLRVEMRAELIRLRTELETTTIYVTHDQTEAMTMGNRVAVLNDGVLQQVGDPLAIYSSPVNLFVAGFIGTPPMNFFSCGVIVHGDEASLSFAGQAIALDREVMSQHPRLAGFHSRDVTVGLRPESFRRHVAPTSPRDQSLTGRVAFVERHGSSSQVYTDIHVDGERVTFVATVAPEDEPKIGDEAPIAFDAAKLHFFDPATGSAI